MLPDSRFSAAQLLLQRVGGLNAEGIVDMESRFGFIESVEVHAFDLVDDEIHDLFSVLFALHLNMGTSNSKNKFLPSSSPSGFCLLYCATNPSHHQPEALALPLIQTLRSLLFQVNVLKNGNLSI